MATAGPWRGVWVAMMNAAIEAIIPTDRSMPPVSIVSVWHAARIASGMAARTVTPTQLGVDGARLDELEGDDEQDEQHAQRQQRPVTEEPPPGAEGQPGRSPAGRRGLRGHRRVLRRASRLPSMTTPIRIEALDDGRQVRVDVEEREVRPDQGQDRDRDDRPDHPAPPAGEAHATEHDGRDLGSV